MPEMEIKRQPEVNASTDGNHENLNEGAQAKAEGPKTNPAWMSQLPDDLKTNETLSQFKTMGEAIKSLMAGNDKSEEPEKVQYTEFKTRVSAEDDPFGDIQKGYEDLFKSRNLKQEDAEGLIEQINKINASAKASMVERGREICEKAVRTVWGNEYEEKRKLMAKGYKALDSDGSLQSELDKSGASLIPAVWEFFSRVGKLVSEDTGSARAVNTSPATGGVPIDYSKPST